ncbi:MAG: hypothetical protein IRZ28_15690 [Steroidobacteraceae bacterium]|nr:hypothetical protein [Steroidobacteraceae bacterium]
MSTNATIRRCALLLCVPQLLAAAYPDAVIPLSAAAEAARLQGNLTLLSQELHLQEDDPSRGNAKSFRKTNVKTPYPRMYRSVHETALRKSEHPSRHPMVDAIKNFAARPIRAARTATRIARIARETGVGTGANSVEEFIERGISVWRACALLSVAG